MQSATRSIGALGHSCIGELADERHAEVLRNAGTLCVCVCVFYLLMLKKKKRKKGQIDECS